MKIIEAMKAVKQNNEKSEELRKRIHGVAANLSNEKPVYGDQTAAKIKEWLQSIEDTGKQNIALLVAIQRTNLVTPVTITLGGVAVTKNIAEWVWRRREYAGKAEQAWRALQDRNLRPQTIPQPTGTALQIDIERHYDPVVRDAKVDEYRSEPHQIDAALEVINAVTDLIEA